MNVILMSYDHIGFPMQYGLFQLAARQILFTEFHPQNIFQMMTRTLQTSIKQSRGCMQYALLSCIQGNYIPMQQMCETLISMHAQFLVFT